MILASLAVPDSHRAGESGSARLRPNVSVLGRYKAVAVASYIVGSEIASEST